jgi:hypothetical protein
MRPKPTGASYQRAVAKAEELGVDIDDAKAKEAYFATPWSRRRSSIRVPVAHALQPGLQESHRRIAHGVSQAFAKGGMKLEGHHAHGQFQTQQH